MRRIKTRLLTLGAVAALTAAIGYAQTTQHEHGTTPSQASAAAQPQMDHQAMMANMQAEQKKLDDLVAQMNAATGQDKVEKIAVVVNELVAREKRMNSMMMMMHGGAAQMPHDQHHQ